MERMGDGSVDSSKITLMKIEKNTVVTLNYRLTDAQDNLIEESGDPMIYLHGGYSGTFPKIEELLEGQEIGFETRIQLEPEEAFGDYDTNLLKVEPRDRFPDPLEVGMQFEGIPAAEDDDSASSSNELLSDEVQIYTVTDIAEDRVVLDGNHPLAGMALRFWVQVADVREATAEELENGHPEGMGLELGEQEQDEEDEEDLDEAIENALNPQHGQRPPTLH